MKLQRLVISNFRSYEKADVAFSAQQNYIFGRNWQGKSSVMDAIGFALFGKRAFPSRLAGSAVRTEHLVHEGKGKGFVRLEFEHNGKTYLLTRECPRENASLTCGSKTLGATSTVVKEALHELLGIDEDLFASVFYSEQDELRKVLQIKPEERKVFIESILGFEYLKDMKLSAKHAFDGLHNWLEGFMSGNIKTAVEMSTEIETNVQHLREELEDLNKQISGLKDVGKKKSDAQKKWADASNQHLKVADQASTLEERRTILTETLDGVSTGKCPTCTQPITGKLVQDLVERFRQTIKKIDSDLRLAKSEVKKAESKLSKVQTDYEFLESQVEELAGLSATKDELKEQLETETSRWERLKKEVRAYENRHKVVKRINEEQAFLGELQLAIDEFRSSLRKSVTSDLENGVNFFMNKFGDGDFDAKLRINEEFGFDIMLHDNSVPLFNLSGAARDILALALRYGLYRIASKELNFLLLDEPTHHFDEVNTTKLKQALNDLTDHQLVIITVHDEFFDAVGRKFVVEKDQTFNSVIRELV